MKNKDPRNHIFILHRLDKETSGVMMFAKNKKVQEILQKNWNEMIRERKYVAVIEGCPQPEQGQVKSYISENTKNPLHRLALHAFKLTFTHPVTGKEMKFETPIPTKFMTLFK